MKRQLAISDQGVSEKIFLIRGMKVMLDKDLAKLYGVLTKNLNKAAKRNIDRFPEDFMFHLSKEELKNLKFQSGTSSLSWGGSRKLPLVFTQLGVSMLSSVLRSKKAIAVNMQIMRVFNRIQELMLTHKEILLKLEALENKLTKHDLKLKNSEEEIQLIFKYLKELLSPKQTPRKKVGYKHYDEK